MSMEKIIKSAITSIIAVTALHVVDASAKSPNKAWEQEKCYGISKAGMNDCETAGFSCAGSAKKDNQHDAYLLLPKGVCNKIVGASLKPLNKS